MFCFCFFWYRNQSRITWHSCILFFSFLVFCSTTLMYFKCTLHLLLQNVPQFEYFCCFLMVRFRLHFCQAHQKILICPIFVMLTLIHWLGKFLSGFSTVKLLLFSLLLIVTYEEILLYLCLDNHPISSSILIFTSSDSCMIKRSLLGWLLHGDFLIPCFPILLAFYFENRLSLFLCLPVLSVSHQDGLMAFYFSVGYDLSQFLCISLKLSIFGQWNQLTFS